MRSDTGDAGNRILEAGEELLAGTAGLCLFMHCLNRNEWVKQMHLIEILRSYTTASQSAPEIAPEFAFEILQNERRRRIIDYLSDFEVGEEIEVSDIAEEIAYGDDYRSAYVACLQSHLPKLDPKATGLQQSGNARIVEYEEQGKTVRVRQELHILNEAHQSCLLALE